MINLIAGMAAVIAAAMILSLLFHGVGILGDLLGKGIKSVGGCLPAMFLVGIPIYVGSSSGAAAALINIEWEIGFLIALWLLGVISKAVRQSSQECSLPVSQSGTLSDGSLL